MELVFLSASLTALPPRRAAAPSAAFRLVLPLSLPIRPSWFGSLIPSARKVSSAALVYGSRGYRAELKCEEEDFEEFEEEVVAEFSEDDATDDDVREAEEDEEEEDEEVIDAEALEEEAKCVLVEYSKSLSRELKLGAVVLKLGVEYLIKAVEIIYVDVYVTSVKMKCWTYCEVLPVAIR